VAASSTHEPTYPKNRDLLAFEPFSGGANGVACVRNSAGVTAGIVPAEERNFRMPSSSLAHSVSEACSIARAGRTSLYEAIRTGALRAVKRGRRTLILDDDHRRWVQSLPPVAVKPAKLNRTEKTNG
jgi:hypothetical protein